MNNEEALTALADATARAVDEVFAGFCGERVERTDVSVLARAADPLEGIAAPAVVSRVSYGGAVGGGNVFAFPIAAARSFAAAMTGAGPEPHGGDLSEVALSAVREGANQMLLGAASATGLLLGQEIEIGKPDSEIVATFDEVFAAFQPTPHVVSISFAIHGEPCRFVQLVPPAFLVRMAVALEEHADQVAQGRFDEQPVDDAETEVDWVGDTTLRVSAELGRAQLPVAAALGLGDGAVVPLDRRAGDPIDVYVNGKLFARGRLLDDEGDWAIKIESLEASHHQD